jgi:hypothetical protein
MKPRGKLVFVILTLALLVSVIGWLIGHSLISPAQNVSAQDQPRGLLATPENLGYLGLTFTPVAVTDNLALSAITRDQAIEVALSNEPGLKAATDIASQLGLLRTVNDSGVTASDLAEGQLVWIITFFGVDTASSGPPGAPRYLSHEYHIVINALTGKYLMAFPLYEVTPKPPTTQ